MKKSCLFISLLFLIGCDSNFEIHKQIETDFTEHIKEADLSLFDGDDLHPTYAFIKNNKVLGLEFVRNPECGEYKTKYFLDEKETVFKVVIQKDFYSEYCEETFDSIYIINPKTKVVETYFNGQASEIKNRSLTEEIDFNRLKKELMNWKQKR